MKQLSEYKTKAIRKLCESIENVRWSNDGLVQLIEHAAAYLNLKSIQEYADSVGKTYNGIKKTKQATVILKQKYIIDND